MAFSVTLFVLSWITFIVFADKKKFRLFWSTCLFGMYLAATIDLLADHYHLWDYPKGTQLEQYSYHLMQQLGVYLVVIYLYIQSLPHKQNIVSMFRHILYWSLLALFLEWLAINIGFMEYKKWWNLGWSYLADWLLFLLLYCYFKWWERGERR
jgi:hypothetical protein